MNGVREKRWKSLLRMMLVLMIAYLASYLILSRTGQEEAKTFNMGGFYYLPMSTLDGPENHVAWGTQFLLMVVYSPANYVDQVLFDAPGPAGQPLWGLSSRRGA